MNARQNSLRDEEDMNVFKLMMSVVAAFQVVIIGLAAWTLISVHNMSVRLENHNQRLETAEWWIAYHRDKWSVLENERIIPRVRREP